MKIGKLWLCPYAYGQGPKDTTHILYRRKQRLQFFLKILKKILNVFRVYVCNKQIAKGVLLLSECIAISGRTRTDKRDWPDETPALSSKPNLFFFYIFVDPFDSL